MLPLRAAALGTTLVVVFVVLLLSLIITVSAFLTPTSRSCRQCPQRPLPFALRPHPVLLLYSSAADDDNDDDDDDDDYPDHHDDEEDDKEETVDIMDNMNEKLKSLKPLHALSARSVDDNGLTIITDVHTGYVTARPRRVVRHHDEEEEDAYSSSTRRSRSTTTTTTTTSKPPQHHKKLRILQEQPAKVVPTSGFNVVLTHCTADFDSLAGAVGLAKLWSSGSSGRSGRENQEEEEDDRSVHDNSKKRNHYNNNDTADNISNTGVNDEDDVEDDKEHFHGSNATMLTVNGTTTTTKTNNNNNTTTTHDSTSDVPTFVVLPRGAHPGVQRFLALHKHLFPIRSLRSLPSDLSGLHRLGLVDAQRRDRVGPAEPLLRAAKRVTVVDHHDDHESDIVETTDYVVDRVGSVSTLVVERLQEAGLQLTEAEATLLALGIHADTGSLCFDSSTKRDARALLWVMEQGASQAAIAEHVHPSLSREQQGVLTQALVNTNSTNVHGVTVSTVLLSADGFINGLAAVTQDALELSSSDVFLLAVVYEAARSGSSKRKAGERLQSRLLKDKPFSNQMHAEAWKGGDEVLKRRRLQAAFDRKDLDGSGFLDKEEISAALAISGVIIQQETASSILESFDLDGDGRVSFDEFVECYDQAEREKLEQDKTSGRNASTMIIIGRVRAGVNLKYVNLNKLFAPFGGGGHPKAASATVRLGDEQEAEAILQGLVDELIETGLSAQPTVGDFMTAPVLSVKPHMTEKQVEDIFERYDVRALPVVNDDNDVIGLVTYKEVAAAKQRLWNKEQKRMRDASKISANGERAEYIKRQRKEGEDATEKRKLGSALKGWMKQHVQVVEAGMTMAEVEAVLFENDVGSIPVVEDGTRKLVGMVTRTDLLRQHRYYETLHYHNKGFSDSIAARKPIIELRKMLKKFDMEDE